MFLPGDTGENLTGALRFELRSSVLETGILPIETTHLQQFWILDFGLVRHSGELLYAALIQNQRRTAHLNAKANPKSKIQNRKRVSDGTRTRNIRFGRPTLSHLSFAHLNLLEF